MEGTAPNDSTRNTWLDSVSTDWSLMGIDPWDAQDHARWRKAVGRKANPAEPGNTTVNPLMVRTPESTQVHLVVRMPDYF